MILHYNRLTDESTGIVVSSEETEFFHKNDPSQDNNALSYYFKHMHCITVIFKTKQKQKQNKTKQQQKNKQNKTKMVKSNRISQLIWKIENTYKQIKIKSNDTKLSVHPRVIWSNDSALYSIYSKCCTQEWIFKAL